MARASTLLALHAGVHDGPLLSPADPVMRARDPSVLPAASRPLRQRRMASKVIKDKGATPDAFELEVGQALADLEGNSPDLKAELRELYIVSAKEVDVAGRKAVVLFVPFRLLKLTHKIQARLVRELEKKFSGKHVVVIAQRRIQRQEAKAGRTLKQKRPQSRTLTAVHDAILEDLVHPTEIVGKHIRYRTDGSKLLKMYTRPWSACCSWGAYGGRARGHGLASTSCVATRIRLALT